MNKISRHKTRNAYSARSILLTSLSCIMVCGSVPLLTMEEPPGDHPRRSTKRPAEQDSPASETLHRNGGIPISLLITREEANHRGMEDYYYPGMLHNAAFEGDYGKVLILLDKGALRVGDCTALILASRQGHKIIVELLLAHQAQVNCSDRERKSALYFASTNGHHEIVGLLLDAGSYIDGSELDSAAEQYGKNGEELPGIPDKSHLEVIRMLIKYGAPVDATNSKTKDVIKRALNKNPIAIALYVDDRHLLKWHIKTATVDQLVEALCYAVGQRRTENIDYLLQKLGELCIPYFHYILKASRIVGIILCDPNLSPKNRTIYKKIQKKLEFHSK